MVQARDNQQGIEALQADGPQREAALSDVRWLLLVGLKTALKSRPDFVESIFEDVVQESLSRAMTRAHTLGMDTGPAAGRGLRPLPQPRRPTGLRDEPRSERWRL
jgi:hypothetical protein